jgi:alanine racemase
MHIFINDLIDIGVQNFVVRYIPDECINRANFFNCQGPWFYNYLQHIIEIFYFPVIGLTGSNGKQL